jgi:hypothetical protein
MFTAEFHGTPFDVACMTDIAHKRPVRCHVITSHDHFEVISSDWKKVLERVHVNDVAKVEPRGFAAYVELRPGFRFEWMQLSTSPKPCELLVKALTPVELMAKLEVKPVALPEIVASFMFNDRAESGLLTKKLVEESSRLLPEFFKIHPASPVNIPFADAVACTYRVRYRNNHVFPLEETVASLCMDIRRSIFELWCLGLIKCVNMDNGESRANRAFSRRLLLGISGTINKAALVLSIDTSDLEEAVQNYMQDAEGEDALLAEEVIGSARKLATDVRADIEAGIEGIRPADEAGFRRLLELAVIVFAGIAAEIYDDAVIILVKKIYHYTESLISTSRHVVETSSALNKGRLSFIMELMTFLDGKRYYQTFQYIYCIWDLGKVMSDDDY